MYEIYEEINKNIINENTNKTINKKIKITNNQKNLICETINIDEEDENTQNIDNSELKTPKKLFKRNNINEKVMFFENSKNENYTNSKLNKTITDKLEEINDEEYSNQQKNKNNKEYQEYLENEYMNHQEIVDLFKIKLKIKENKQKFSDTTFLNVIQSNHNDQNDNQNKKEIERLKIINKVFNTSFDINDFEENNLSFINDLPIEYKTIEEKTKIIKVLNLNKNIKDLVKKTYIELEKKSNFEQTLDLPKKSKLNLKEKILLKIITPKTKLLIKKDFKTNIEKIKNKSTLKKNNSKKLIENNKDEEYYYKNEDYNYYSSDELDENKIEKSDLKNYKKLKNFKNYKKIKKEYNDSYNKQSKKEQDELIDSIMLNKDNKINKQKFINQWYDWYQQKYKDIDRQHDQYELDEIYKEFLKHYNKELLKQICFDKILKKEKIDKIYEEIEEVKNSKFIGFEKQYNEIVQKYKNEQIKEINESNLKKYEELYKIKKIELDNLQNKYDQLLYKKNMQDDLFNQKNQIFENNNFIPCFNINKNSNNYNYDDNYDLSSNNTYLCCNKIENNSDIDNFDFNLKTNDFNSYNDDLNYKIPMNKINSSSINRIITTLNLNQENDYDHNKKELYPLTINMLNIDNKKQIYGEHKKKKHNKK